VSTPPQDDRLSVYLALGTVALIISFPLIVFLFD
jgi:hypothetical protein